MKTLDRTPERPGAVPAVLAGPFEDPIDDVGGQLELDPPVDEVVVEPLDQQPRDRPQVVVRERLDMMISSMRLMNSG